MKAIVQEKYGAFDLLEFAEAEKPIPKIDEVLVRNYASSINFGNLALTKGEPFIARFWSGLFKPKHINPGGDVAGRIEAIGANVTKFAVGDEVYADLADGEFGAFAEYVCVPESSLALKPHNMTYAESAAVAQAAIVALQGLRLGNIQAGQQVLICGASGGIGTFAIQIAKALDTEVTAVCSTRNVELCRSLGADHIIDYTKNDFLKTGKRYDLILATAGYRPITEYKQALTAKGNYVSTGGEMKQIFQALLLGPFLSKKNGKRFQSLMHKQNADDLNYMRELIETGKVNAIVEKKYPLNKVAEAMKFYKAGKTRGKVVIDIQ